MTAQSGFWRLPWASSDTLVFAPCPIPENCIGSQGRGEGSSSQVAESTEESGTGANRLLGAATPVHRPYLQPRSRQLQASGTNASSSRSPPELPPITFYTEGDDALSSLNPASMERCVDGHGGVLCTGCVQGWTRDGVFACEQCPSPGVWVLSLFVALLGAVIVWVFAGWSVDRVVYGVRPSQYRARHRRGVRPKGFMFWLSGCDLCH